MFCLPLVSGRVIRPSFQTLTSNVYSILHAFYSRSKTYICTCIYWDLYIQIFICNMLLMLLITWLFPFRELCGDRMWCWVTERNTIPKGTRMIHYLKISVMIFWSETCLKCFSVLPMMKTCLSVTILCLRWGTYVIYLSLAWAPKTIFTLCSAPEISSSFKPLSNSNYWDASEVFQS